MSEPALRHILAFDCSGAACSTALWVETRLVGERFAAMARGQGEALMPQIQEIMAEAQLDFCDLDAIATTIGPGSFTGLRLGLAAARGLVLATERPLIAVTGFEALLAGLSPAQRGTGKIAVAIDSRRGPVFAQLFAAGGGSLGAPVAVDPAAFESWLPREPVVIVADAGAAIASDGPGRIVYRAAIRAANIVRRAAELGRNGFDRLAPAPLYLRPPDVTIPAQHPAS